MASKRRVARSVAPAATGEAGADLHIATLLGKPELHPVALAIKEAGAMLVFLDDVAAGDPSSFGGDGPLPKLLKMDEGEITSLLKCAAREHACKALREALDAFTALCQQLKPLVAADRTAVVA